ncbi:heme NO-binding domain-containing protein [uncultured Roseobacter sp.]|uniref:heme NO-binding domain-containing protein n=1 Tax=uncultured Roseobacter sp. TaxID=114847 RepID=UPI002611F2CD|nr:heme NO-binding domain-containing protein [uncultured Roseobacter sp.]
MYGMINEGIRAFILKHHDKETWEAICQKASVGDQQFDGMKSYDDGITYQLVGAISEHTGLSSGEVLTKFGSHWVDYAGESRFGNLMKVAGDSFLERLNGLDDMHARIQLSMPNLKPPSFKLEEVADRTYRLHYFSQRTGLDSMVVGLLYGMAEETGEKIKVNQIAEKSDTVDHSVFEIAVVN